MLKIIGIYPIENKEPVHMIEILIKNLDGIFDLNSITQEVVNQPRENWQVPYMEHILNEEGTEILANDLEASRKPELWKNGLRMVFFFHYLDSKKNLITPWGEVRLPKETEMPGRLKKIIYEPPY